MADSGPTSHMVPGDSAFVSYCRVTHLRIYMDIEMFTPVLGKGLAIIEITGRKVLVCDCLHIPDF